MARRHRVLFWLVGAPLLLVVAVVAFLSTPPGTRFIVRRALPIIQKQINGQLAIKEIRGSIFGRLDFRGVTVSDPNGKPLATADRVVVGYRVIDLIRGQIKIDPLIVEHPDIQLVQAAPGEPYPLLQVFQKKTTTNAARSSLTVRGLQISDGSAIATVPNNARPAGVERASSEPLLRTVRVQNLGLKMPLLSMESGGGGPLDAEVRIDQANAKVSDPKLELRDLSGRAAMKGDSISVDLKNAQLPQTRLSMKGWVVMDSAAKPAFNGDIHIANLSTSDLAALSPQVPAGWHIRGDVHAEGRKTGDMSADFKTLEVVTGKQAGAVRGHLAMSVAPDGHWRQKDTRLEFDNLDLAPLMKQMKQPPSVPVSGRLDGKLVADGPQDSLKLQMDLGLKQTVSDTVLTSKVKGGGEVSLPLGGQLAVRDFTIDTARLEMRGIRTMSPSMPLVGHVDMKGKLKGNAQDMAFSGAARYQEAGLPPSNVRATVRVTHHSPYHMEADVELDSLRLQGLQMSFPQLAQGTSIGGRVHLSGPLDTLAIDANVGGAPGRVRLTGIVSSTPGTIAVKNADLKADSINLAAVSADWPKSFVFARITGSATMKDSTLQSADLRVTVDTSRVGGMNVDNVSLVAKTGGGLLMIDSLLVRATGLKIDGGGNLGLTDHRGTVTVKVRADSLDQLGPLFELVSDSANTMLPHSGGLALDATVTGSMKDYTAEFKGTAKKIVTRNAGIYAGTFNGRWAAAKREFAIQAGIDSLSYTTYHIARLDAGAAGTPEALTWKAAASFSHHGKFASVGKVSGDSVRGRTFDLDSLSLTRDSATWRLEQPAQIELLNDRWQFSNTVLVRKGPGDPARVAVTGALTAKDSTGKVSAVIENFPLADLAIYPSTGKGKPLQGTVDAKFDLAGSVKNPTGAGQFTLLNAKWDTLPLPELRAKADYTGGVLNANAAIILGSRPSVLEAHVPLRKGTSDNNARLSFTADSLTLGWMDPLLPTVQGLAGRIDGKVEMQGTFERPDLSGGLALTGGEATVLSTGVSYHELTAKLSFSGRTIRLDQFTTFTGNKDENETFALNGDISLEDLTDPTLDLEGKANNFNVMNDPNLFQGDATGDIKVKGPFYGATVTGTATVSHGTVFVDQFVQKRVVDLSDSLFAQFVDTTVLREQKLGADPVTLFVAGLYIDGLDVDLGDNFWMKSADANIELQGNVAMGKVGRKYTVDGTVSTVRGTYTLRLAPGTSREFQVEQGSIRYFGTTDLNAILDVNASHELQTASSDPMTVFVHIGGTILEPKIDLTADMEPPLTQSEVISYLIFGAPSFQAFMNDRNGQKRSVFETSVKSFAGILSGQLEHSLAGFLPLDYFKIQPGEVQTGLSGTELIMGKQVTIFGKPSWLKASPRICPREQLLSMDQIGLSLESRLSHHFGVAASLDPLRGCESALPPASSHYGLGLDIYWEKRGIGFKKKS